MARCQTIDNTFDFESRPYLPIKRRGEANFIEVACGDVRLQRAAESGMRRIASWLQEERIYGPLGFSRSIPEKCVRRSVVPDLTGTMETVDFLIIDDAGRTAPFGFVICYDARKYEDPDQEVDMALGDPAFEGRFTLVRSIKIAVLTYLFAVCGAQTVQWIRRKRNAAEEGTRFRRRGTTSIVDRDGFASILQSLARSRERSPLPIVAYGASSLHDGTTQPC